VGICGYNRREWKEQAVGGACKTHWDELKEQGFTPLCADFEADGSEVICDVFIDAGFGAAQCIACRQAYRKDEEGNLEYYR
jgi:hypothetical protein